MKRLSLNLILAACAFTLASCATQQHPIVISHKVEPAGENLFRVTAVGDRYAPKNGVKLMCARAAADHVAATGGKYFVVISQANKGYDNTPTPTDHKAAGMGQHMPLIDKRSRVSLKTQSDMTMAQGLLLEFGTGGIFGVVACLTPVNKSPWYPHSHTSSMLVMSCPDTPPPNSVYYEPQTVLATIRQIAPTLPAAQATPVTVFRNSSIFR